MFIPPLLMGFSESHRSKPHGFFPYIWHNLGTNTQWLRPWTIKAPVLVAFGQLSMKLPKLAPRHCGTFSLITEGDSCKHITMTSFVRVQWLDFSEKSERMWENQCHKTYYTYWGMVYSSHKNVVLGFGNGLWHRVCHIRLYTYFMKSKQRTLW